MTPTSANAARATDSAGRLAQRLAAGLTAQPAAIHAVDGRIITTGTAEFTGNPGAWRATLRNLDRPGQVATSFFAEGVRDVILALEDGRQARARITGTSFLASSQRVCQLEGLERLN
jgi:hypothetical protein